MFLDKFKELCESRNTKVRTVAKELGIGNSTVSKWLNGTIPQVEHIKLIAEYFDVSLDYLVGDEDVSIKPSKKGFSDDIKIMFRTFRSLPQRWASLRRGDEVPNDVVTRIAEYTDCDFVYLLNEGVAFNPSSEYDKTRLFETNTLHLILDIMDKCADSEPYRVLQVQLSRIVLYHLNIIGVTEESIKEKKHLDTRKLHYIATGEKNRDTTLNYGFNYSDLSCLLDDFTEIPNYQFMFTGIKENPVDLLKGDAELREKILNK